MLAVDDYQIGLYRPAKLAACGAQEERNPAGWLMAGIWLCIRQNHIKLRRYWWAAIGRSQIAVIPIIPDSQDAKWPSHRTGSATSCFNRVQASSYRNRRSDQRLLNANCAFAGVS